MIAPIIFRRDRVPIGQKATPLELLERRLRRKIKNATYPNNCTYYVWRATDMPLRFGRTVGGISKVMYSSIVRGMRNLHHKEGWML